MKEYTITIEETLARQVKVKAENLEVATEQVERQYRKGDIVLDSSNYMSTWIGSLSDSGYHFVAR